MVDRADTERQPESADADAAHRVLTRREFAKQAPSFEREGSIFRDRDVLDWICDQLPHDPGDLVLDVAGGTGRLGRRLAARAAFAAIADLTPQMLDEGIRSARDEGTENVVFLEADATRLPFAADQFDLVGCRFAMHHFEDATAAAREMARVCVPGGTVAVIDLVREPGAAGERHDELERLRDPSHTSSLTEQELLDALDAAGLAARVASERRQRMPLGPWLDQSAPAPDAREQVERAVAAEADGAAATGLNGARDEQGRLSIEHRWLVVVGVKPS